MTASQPTYGAHDAISVPCRVHRRGRTVHTRCQFVGEPGAQMFEKRTLLAIGRDLNGAPHKDRHFQGAEHLPETKRSTVDPPARCPLVLFHPGVTVDEPADSARTELPADELRPGHVLESIAEVCHLPIENGDKAGLIVDQVPGSEVTVDENRSPAARRPIPIQPIKDSTEHGELRCGRRVGGPTRPFQCVGGGRNRRVEQSRWDVGSMNPREQVGHLVSEEFMAHYEMRISHERAHRCRSSNALHQEEGPPQCTVGVTPRQDVGYRQSRSMEAAQQSPFARSIEGLFTFLHNTFRRVHAQHEFVDPTRSVPQIYSPHLPRVAALEPLETVQRRCTDTVLDHAWEC